MPKNNYEQYIGKKIHMLTIISLCIEPGRAKCVVQCECGKVKKVEIREVLRDSAKSCGCLAQKKVATIDGVRIFEHPLYKKYQAIKGRCYNPENNAYKHYGQRGIKMSQEWLDSYEKFYAWSLANGYDSGLEIDRENNDGDYSAENCRYVTSLINNRNKRSNTRLTYNGQTKSMAEWSEIVNISYGALQTRVYRGWDTEKALEQPIQLDNTVNLKEHARRK